MPLNLVEKTVACLVSPNVSIWDYCQRRDGPRFCYWIPREHGDEAATETHFFATFEGMIEAAYATIDPLQKPIPERVEAPPA